MIGLRDVQEGTGGRILGDVTTDVMFNNVRHDSRTIEEGDLFVAIVGDRLDGHNFVADAFSRGASGAIVDQAHASALANESGVLIVVDDTTLALQRLSRYWRGLFNVKVIGITGSMGKSSVKEVVAAVLKTRFNTIRSRASYNNELGLPLTMLEIGPDTEVAVLEMGGAYRHGEIRELAQLAHPDIGIVTNVSHSHVQRMGSLDEIARNKSELPESLGIDGYAILNGDDFRVREMASICRSNVILYGLAPDCDIRARNVESEGLDGISFELLIDDERYQVNVPLIGRHSVHTALAAIATGYVFGLSVDEMLHGFNDSSVQLRLLTVPGIGGSTLIDDTYNANPSSCLAALNLIAELDAKRKIGVFGDILELGNYEQEGHEIVGRRAAVVLDMLYTVGERAQIIADTAIDQGLSPDLVRTFDDKKELAESIGGELRDGDLVLVKGSRGVMMEEVVDLIRDPDQSD